MSTDKRERDSDDEEVTSVVEEDSRKLQKQEEDVTAADEVSWVYDVIACCALSF